MIGKVFRSAECCSLTSNCKLLVGGDDICLDGAVIGGNLDDFAAALVGLFVKLDAEVAEVLHDFGANEAAVLADTGCESDVVNAVHGSSVSADILGNTIAECIDGQLAGLVACKIAVFQITEVGGLAVGQSEDTGLLVEDRYDLSGCHVLFACDELDDGGINVAAAGAHDQAFKGSKAHGSVDTLAIADSGNGSAVAQVADDGLDAVIRLAGDLCHLLGNEGVAGAVEAVTAVETKAWLVPWKP